MTNQKEPLFTNRDILYTLISVIAVMLVPIIAMKYSPFVSWGYIDFMKMGAFLFACGLTITFVNKRVIEKHRKIMVVVIGACLLFMWLSYAIEISGMPPNNY